MTSTQVERRVAPTIAEFHSFFSHFHCILSCFALKVKLGSHGDKRTVGFCFFEMNLSFFYRKNNLLDIMMISKKAVIKEFDDELFWNCIDRHKIIK